MSKLKMPHRKDFATFSEYQFALAQWRVRVSHKTDIANALEWQKRGLQGRPSLRKWSEQRGTSTN